MRVPASNNSLYDELRARNYGLLFWSTIIFQPILIAWSTIDYYLVPELWREFLGYRVIAAISCFAVLGLVQIRGLRRYTFEAFWVWHWILATCVALMLPQVGASFLAFLAGFLMILAGAILLPLWPPRWGVSNMCVGLLTALLIWQLAPEHAAIPQGHLITGLFVTITVLLGGMLVGHFKLELVRRDFSQRQQLAHANREHAQALQELSEAHEKLTEVDKIKTQFFANVSHELRNPLTLILAPVERLLARIDGERHRNDLIVVQKNAERLLRLINDFLELARLDAGGFALNKEALELKPLLASLVEIIRPTAEANDIEIVFNATSRSAIVEADGHRLEIIFTNLLGNALKHTPKGGRIEVGLRIEEGFCVIDVKDTGLGITEEALPHIFERFYQAPRKDGSWTGGAGIGLALAKQLTELHDGDLSVHTVINEGTTFRLTLPRVHSGATSSYPPAERSSSARGFDSWRPSEPPPPTPSMPPVQLITSARPHVLLVEDQIEIREFIRELMEPEFEVVDAPDGPEALALIEKETPDIVVSDVMMPKMDGTILCQKIKEHPVWCSIPVILLTARVGSDATLEAYEHGADDFVSKPFQPKVLLARVRAQLRLRALSAQLAQQEKLVGIGTLAAGVAHEIRNPINAIVNAAKVLRNSKTKRETEERLLDVIIDGSERIDGIVEALNTHVRPSSTHEIAKCDLGLAIHSTLQLLHHKMRDVEVDRDYPETIAVSVKPGPMNQVLLNLIDNAVRSGAKKLSIKAHAENGRVITSISDNGPGIPESIVHRVTDPFFTTRAPGEGTGLGLYLSHQIISEHGGELHIDPGEGKGATFTIDLPAST